MFKRMQNEKGFTLIELLVVIAIIGLLASVIIASLSTARSKARDSTRLSDIKQIQTGLTLYYNNCNDYPATSEFGTSTTDDCPAGTLISDFLDEGIFTDPDGNAYAYASAGDDEYCLGTDFEDENHSKANATNPDITCDTANSLTMGSATSSSVDYVVSVQE